MIPLATLLARHAQRGEISGIWLRPARLETPISVETAELQQSGLVGDHARLGKRSVTLIQAEHLPVIGAFLGRGPVAAHLLRRNLVISGLNLAALRGATLTLGADACIEITVPCAPCSRMETALGHGGYNALRGHGGWCARVLHPGFLRCGDPVQVVSGPVGSVGAAAALARGPGPVEPE